MQSELDIYAIETAKTVKFMFNIRDVILLITLGLIFISLLFISYNLGYGNGKSDTTEKYLMLTRITSKLDTLK